jgi:NAD(P)-dependent dehydrogenase (short-subunit alcohol dehydrogenase family)
MRGVRVFGVARHANGDLARRYGDALTQVQLDLGDAVASSEWLRANVIENYVRGADIALLVNNAGVLQPVGPLDSLDTDLVKSAVAVNVGAALALSAAFARATRSIKDRRILHISSGAGRHAYEGWSVYCASKAALDHHARAVALERSTLRICSVAPGVIDTEMQAEIRASSDELIPDRPHFVEMKREGRLVSADAAGRAVVEFLLSETFGAEPVTDLRHTHTRGT